MMSDYDNDDDDEYANCMVAANDVTHLAGPLLPRPPPASVTDQSSFAIMTACQI